MRNDYGFEPLLTRSHVCTRLRSRLCANIIINAPTRTGGGKTHSRLKFRNTKTHTTAKAPPVEPLAAATLKASAGGLRFPAAAPVSRRHVQNTVVRLTPAFHRPTQLSGLWCSPTPPPRYESVMRALRVMVMQHHEPRCLVWCAGVACCRAVCAPLRPLCCPLQQPRSRRGLDSHLLRRLRRRRPEPAFQQRWPCIATDPAVRPWV